MYFKHVLLLSSITLFLSLITITSCDPLVTTFDDEEGAVMYQAVSRQSPPDQVSRIKVMVWNIRFGAGRLPSAQRCRRVDHPGPSLG